MSSSVEVSQRGGVRILTVRNPPVNGLGAAVRAGLAEALREAERDAETRALVVTGAGKMFSGGADIREFNAPPPPDTPSLSKVIEAYEDSNKPVVAAIHGVAAGGGLELALGCHGRVAAPGTRLGLPEVTLGIIPGAGGTQRLPRLIGVAPALDLIVSGKLIPEEKALTLGIVDEVAEDYLDAAVRRAEAFAEANESPRKSSTLDAALEEARAQPQLFEDFEKAMARKARGFHAPFAAVTAVRGAVELSFPEGLAQERRLFEELVSSDQAKAQRHAFFAEREVWKIPDVPKDTPTKTIEHVGVVGCGTMGGGIAMSVAAAGIPVTVMESSSEALERGLAKIKKLYASSVSKGRLRQDVVEERLGRIHGTLELSDLARGDIVIEAAFEDMGVKKDIFTQLDQTCAPDTILASNTSSLDINEIASVTSRPDKVMGTHFFSPAHIMRLMENVRGTRTSKETIATVMKLTKRLDKIGVLVGVCDGFVGNRMLYAYRRQADFLIEEGALPQQVDQALFDFGLPMGPFAMADLAGLDIGWSVRQKQAPTRPKHLRYSPVADRIYEMGRLGQKTGAGWYRYEEGSRTPIPDPEIQSLIENVSKKLGFERRAIDEKEIIERCIYAMVNEGAKILDEGLALRSSDIDVVWMNGYGFPRYRGGPMFHADTVSLETVYQAMARFHAAQGEWMTPAPLLARLAKEGGTFADYERAG